MTVYVLHFDPPFRHARHYVGYTPEATAERRVQEHLDCSAKGSPLVKAALNVGCKVTLAHEFPGAGRDFERWLKTRRDTAKWCGCCGQNSRPLPRAENISDNFKGDKPQYGRRAA